MTQQELDEKVMKAYATEECQKPILDGIVNEELFRSGIPKILWLMKEPYGEQDWNMRTELNESSKGMFWYKTFKNVTYCSYGIINHVTFLEAKAAVANYEILKSIAFINVSKCPVQNKVNPNRWPFLTKTFETHKSVLLEQIEYINPDIIIGGGIAALLINHYNLDWDTDRTPLSTNKGWFQKDNRLIIDAHHPSAIVSQGGYCTEIIATATTWLSKRQVF